MSENQNTAAGRGHVRAVFSERCRGFAAPLDLVLAHLRALRLSAAAAWNRAVYADLVYDGFLYEQDEQDEQDEQLKKLEVRGRVRAAFSDYLVSECDGGQFAPGRKKHAPAFDRVATTGRAPWSFDLQWEFLPSEMIGCIDAPEYISTGAMRTYRCEQSGDKIKAPGIAPRGV